jgi:hypothetical protein
MAVPVIDGTNSYSTSGTTSLTHTVPLPTSGVAQNKLLVVAFGYSGPLTNNEPELSGWTFIGTGGVLWNYSTSIGFRVGYKVAGASESDPTFTMSTSAVHVAAASLVISGVGATPIDASDAFDNGDVNTGTNSSTAPAVTTSGADRLVLRLAVSNTSSSHTWATSSINVSALSSTTLRNLSVASFGLPTQGTTGSETVSATAGQWVAATIAIAPSGGETTHNPTPADSVGVTDTAARLATYMRPPQDAAAVSDNVVSNLGWSGRTTPNVLLGKKGLTGNLSDVQDDPDSPDSNWLVVG